MRLCGMPPAVRPKAVYQKNIGAFYRRNDFEEITGIYSGDVRTLEFAALPYRPRHTQEISGEMAGRVWEETGAACGTVPEDRESKGRRQEASLYLHIPFCNLSCTYCGFYKDKAQDALIAEYSRRLVQELALWQEKGVFENRLIKAVFFGGGTPSVLSPEQIRTVLSAIHANAVLAEDCEITFESSIYDMDPEKFTACLAGGVNRFSFGIQTFDTQLRRSVGRPDSQETILAQLERFTGRGARIVIDLIYGLPGQASGHVLQDLELAAAAGISGLDLYKLQILPGSPLGKAIREKRKEYEFGKPELADIFMRSALFLQEKGFRQLSCCHWAAVPEEESRYNTMAKRGDDMISCGCSCGGALGPYKFMKMYGLAPYMRAVDAGQIPVMAFRKQSEYYLLLEALNGQVDRGGLDFNSLRKLAPVLLEELLRPVLKKWEECGLLVPAEGMYRLTTGGAFWYRDMARVLLHMTETALWGEETEGCF